MKLRRSLLAGFVALALLATACGADDREGTAAAAELQEDLGQVPEAAPTTEERRPTAEDPLRVLMAGDSIMLDVSRAVSASVQAGGRAVARLAEEPSIPRDEDTRDRWRQRLARFDPEVIVILIGVWEAMATGGPGQHPLGSVEWERAYRDRLLDPYVELLASRGAKVVWIGMPPVLNAARQRGFNAMNRAVRHSAEASDALSYVPGDQILARPDGSWTAFLPGPQGNPQRVRRVDTTHLCADGVVRLARPVLRFIDRQWGVPPAPNWPSRGWRQGFPADECPPKR